MHKLAPRHDPLQVLCVQDDPLEQKLLAACIHLIGGEAVFAEDGSRALSLFRGRQVDFVLLDLNQSDGFTALNRIRLSGRHGQTVPILAVTENVTGLPETAYRRLGFNGLYVKPIEPYRLLDRIDASLIAAGQPPLFLLPVA